MGGDNLVRPDGGVGRAHRQLQRVWPGSLITSRTVLTAGHCINPASTNVAFRIRSVEFFARDVLRYPGYFEHQDAQGHVFDIDGDLAICQSAWASARR
jgi:hypothetical protein